MSRAKDLARELRAAPRVWGLPSKLVHRLDEAADLLDRIDALEAVAKASAALLVFGQKHGAVCWHAHNREGTACEECRLLNEAIGALRALQEVPCG